MSWLKTWLFGDERNRLLDEIASLKEKIKELETVALTITRTRCMRCKTEVYSSQTMQCGLCGRLSLCYHCMQNMGECVDCSDKPQAD